MIADGKVVSFDRWLERLKGERELLEQQQRRFSRPFVEGTTVRQPIFHNVHELAAQYGPQAALDRLGLGQVHAFRRSAS